VRSMEHVQLVPDDAISPGGCTVRFGAGQIDATIETQLRRIADELLVTQEAQAGL
jgi:flagellar biosynthesis/type III secretory pathway protein FliH